MISSRKLLEYMLDAERRFSLLENRIENLKSELTAQGLMHKLEIQDLKSELDRKTSVAELETAQQKPETDEEQLIAEEEEQTANIMQLYTEDTETLRRLGFRIPSGGNVNDD